MNPNGVEMVTCQACGSKNRIPADRRDHDARCGKCGQSLRPTAQTDGAAKVYTLRCSTCHAKNRIPADKIDAGPKCGKCGDGLKPDELFVPQPIIVNDTNFEDKVIQSPLPVLMFAWAPWCPSCRTYTGIVDEFARDAKTRIRVVKVNVDASPGLAGRFNIMSVPFLFVFDGGQMKESMPGGTPKHDLMMKLSPYLN